MRMIVLRAQNTMSNIVAHRVALQHRGDAAQGVVRHKTRGIADCGAIVAQVRRVDVAVCADG